MGCSKTRNIYWERGMDVQKEKIEWKWLRNKKGWPFVTLLLEKY